MSKSEKTKKIIRLFMTFVLITFVMFSIQPVAYATTTPLPRITVQSDASGAYFKTPSGPITP